MTTAKYIGAFIAAVATAPAYADHGHSANAGAQAAQQSPPITATVQNPVLGAQNHTFGSTPGYIGTKIDLAKNQYQPGEPVNYTLDVFAQTTDGKAVPVSGYEIVVKISPLETLADQCVVGQGNCDDILFRTFPKDYSANQNGTAPLTVVPEVNTTTRLPSLAPGQYAVFTSGTIGGTLLTKAAYDVFTVVEPTPAVAQADPYTLYEGIPFVMYAGRYGANKEQPKKSNGFPYEGIVRVTGGEIKTSAMNLSTNFEFETPETDPEQLITGLKKLRIDATVRDDSFGTVYVDGAGTVYREALLAYHLAQGKQDIWDIGNHDIDLEGHLRSRTVLAFDQDYEMKQDAVRDGVGRSSHLNNIPLHGQYTAGEGALALSVDRPDEGWLVKATYKDSNNNGSFDATEQVLGIDVLGVGIHNKSANASLVGTTAFVGGVLTGFGLSYLIPHPPIPGGNGPDTTPEPTGDGFDDFGQYDLIAE